MGKEEVIIIISSIAILLLMIKYLNWKKYYPVNIVFIVVVGLTNSVISEILVIRDYLKFPWRPFKDFIMTNILYDIFFLPSFLLLLLVISIKKKIILIPLVFFVSFTVLQDYLVNEYTMLLEFKRWTLVHTGFTTFVVYIIWMFFLRWLNKHFYHGGEY